MTLLSLGTSKIIPALLVRSKRKLTVYTAEFNVTMGAFRYLPFSTGLLRAFALTDPIIKNNVTFMPFLYEMDTVKNIWNKIIEPPDVFAFSLSMWNEQLSLAVAKRVKETFGDSVLIIFGGCHVPHHPTEYMEKHSFIDVCVRSEGEEAFRDILLRYIEGSTFEDIPDATYRIDNGICIESVDHRAYQKDMDCYPSPYTTGLFDYLLESQTESHRFQCIVESNRGCIAEGTRIQTLEGYRTIEDIMPGEKVLGWDEDYNKIIWNTVEKSVYTGEKEVLSISAGNHNVEATEDHPIYTKRGWIRADQIRQGDYVLCRVPGFEEGEVDEDLFLQMQYRVQEEVARREKEKDQKILWGMRQENKTKIQQTSDNDFQQDVFPSMRKYNDQREQTGRPQSYEKRRYSQEGKRNEQGSMRSSKLEENERIVGIWENNTEENIGRAEENSVRVYDQQQSNEETGSRGKTIEVYERMVFGYREQGGMVKVKNTSTKQVREESSILPRKERSAIQVFGGLDFLDRSMQIGEVQKPRLHSHQQFDKESNSSPRTILAQRSNISRYGDRRLQKSRLGLFHSVGRRFTRRPDHKKDHGFLWIKVTSVISRGIKKVYDLINATPYPNFFAGDILVHNCPFDCSFCYWAAGGLMTKYRFHSLDYTKDEITFVGKHHIQYLFMADSNFAMHPRDKEIAEHAVRTKREYGTPDKLRVCWGKNTDEKVFQVAGILHQANLEKGITLARQSNDPTTLKNIRRDNIKLSTYQTLQKRFMDQNTPTYTELILGLPGETTQSWKDGVDEVLTSGHLKAQLFVYLCQVLPNTELWRPEYREKHGIKTRMVELTEIHGSKRDPEWITEYEEIVIATNTLPYQDWRKACKFSWMTMLLHSMKTGFFIMGWLWDRFKIPPSEFISAAVNHSIMGGCRGVLRHELNRWEELLDRIAVFGESRGHILDDYGNIYWDVEEAALLRLAENWHFFYEDLGKIVKGVLYDNGLSNNENRINGTVYITDEFQSVMKYQELRMPHTDKSIASHTFLYNVPEYFDNLFGSSPVPLTKKSQTMIVQVKDWEGDKERFARETILWGRKSGTMLVPCEWHDVDPL